MVHVSKLSALLILLAHHVIGKDEEQFGQDKVCCPPDLKAYIAKYSADKPMKSVTLTGIHNNINNKKFREATCNLKADHKILLDQMKKPSKNGISKQQPCGLLIEVAVGQHRGNRSTIACKLDDSPV
ncbi:hypothetical protein BCR37DRAFT_389331 [Protomyces lactucae-debilis]|uniref:Uncharacterized protein n=1 Tax=Protomyces lactucae-debilis TaxID=2754530 RepID=A0A1Y2EYB3_PROLT|nr:uncharacterized protein BCR37DRAFT_389331 [Protomyces lactucae-debilis]ORY76612.1 hypothetical protein BCR37DRAFT_389331 [Protomyces lactucae-debilis]